MPSALALPARTEKLSEQIAGKSGMAARLSPHDTQSIAEICQSHHDFMLRTAYRILRDWHAANDCCQEIFIKLMTGKIRYDPDRGSIETFLKVVVKNYCLDLLKSQQHRSARYNTDLLSLLAVPSQPLEETTLPSGTKPDIRTMLDTLSPEFRGPIISHFMEGLSCRQAAKTSGLPLSTWVHRLKSGLDILKGMILSPLA